MHNGRRAHFGMIMQVFCTVGVSQPPQAALSGPSKVGKASIWNKTFFSCTPFLSQHSPLLDVSRPTLQARQPRVRLFKQADVECKCAHLNTRFTH